MANDSRFNVELGKFVFGKYGTLLLTHPKNGLTSFKYRFKVLNLDGTLYAELGEGEVVMLNEGDIVDEVWLQLTPERVEKIPNGKYFDGYLALHVDSYVADTLSKEDFIVNKYPFKVYVSDAITPKITVDVRPVNSVAKLEEWGIYVRGKSKVGFTVSVSAQRGAGVQQLGLRLGKVYEEFFPNPATSSYVLEGNFLLDAYEIEQYGNTVEGFTVDTRGVSKNVLIDTLIYDYSPPVIRDVIVYRCDANGVPDGKGTHLRAQCEGDCTSLGGRNTITSVTARYGVGTLGNAIALTNGVEQVIATGLDPNTEYTVELTVQDDVGETATETIVGDKPRTALHLKDGGKGFAIGKRSTEDGFHCGWDATFDKDVAILGGLTIGGKTLVDILYPVGSIYLTATGAHPALLFGGTWERIKDAFLLGAGDAYEAGDTGGTAEETLNSVQIPRHAHYVNGTTEKDSALHEHDVNCVYQSGDGTMGYVDGTIYKFGSKSTSSGGEAHTHEFYAISSVAGLGEAHNNMPPYCVVNVWKRTA